MASTPSMLTKPIPTWAVLGFVLTVTGASLALSRFEIGYGGVLGWLTELIVSWSPLALLTLALPFKMSWAHRLALMVLTGVAVFYSAAPIARHSNNPTELTVATANLEMGQADLARISEWAQSADVLVLQEVTHTAAAALEAVEGWRFRVVLPDASPFGIAVLSHRPFNEVEHGSEEDGQPVTIRLLIDMPSGSVPLVAVHPFPPINPDAHVRRDALIEREARWLTHRGGGVLVGDLNATAWGTGLHRAKAAGFSSVAPWAVTWPTPFANGYLGITLDHVLISTNTWCATRASRGPSNGSDHLPMMAEVTRCEPLAD